MCPIAGVRIAAIILVGGAVLTAEGSEPSLLRFGVFDLDIKSGELRKAGVDVKLPPQPSRVLVLLASRPWQLVTREELRQQVWGKETFVDFEHGLNSCIKQIRAVLHDDAEAPRYIETRPRRGYRFIAPVEKLSASKATQGALLQGLPSTAPRVSTRRFWVAVLGLVPVLVAAAYFARGAVTRHAVSPPEQSLAVLPFVNLSGEPANEYLSDGLSEELISTLAQIPGLRVPARTSSFYFKGKALPVRQIGESLRVAHVLEGSLRRVGNRLRINAQLIKVADGYHLWSETYSRELARGQEVLAVQEELARAIVDALPLERGVVAGTATAHRHTENPKAYDLYLRGRYLWNRGTPEALNRARDFFAAAIAEDSTYARAYSGLADTYDRLYVLRYIRWADAHTRARAAAYRAVELDPKSVEAYTSRGRIRYILEWDWSGAESDLRQAITLNPGHAMAHLWYGRLLVYLGRFTEGTRAASRATELEPLSPQVLVQYARTLFQAHQYERSVEQARKALELEVSAEGYQLLGENYTQQDQFDDAIRAYRSALGLLGGRGRTTRIIANLGVVYARAGRRQQALKILDSLKSQAGQAAPAPHAISVAILHAALGQKDEAFAWLEQGLQEHDFYLALLRVDPFVDPLRSDPRFRALLKKTGLER